MTIRLNIGAGETEIEGYTPIDRKQGLEAYPLAYEDNSVDAIRASHILEHFGHGDVPKVLNEWVRVLKPGGRIRIAVPDMRKIGIMAVDDSDPRWLLYLMGGQTDANDFHKTVFTREKLEEAMVRAGIEQIESWTSNNTDCAALPVSLNLQGRKSPMGVPKAEALLKVSAIMSVPRVGWSDAYAGIVDALRPSRIPIQQFNGVFWGQCMQRAFEEAVEAGVDWLLTIDYDSMILPKHVAMLMDVLGRRPEVDAIAAMQARRGEVETPLMTVKDQTAIDTDGSPIKVDTAHFGLTFVRLDALKDVPKPWFASKAAPDGGWGEGRYDDDIWFWHQWREAGKTLYVHPQCRIGHLQLMVSEYDEKYQPRHLHIKTWRERGKDDAD